MKTNQIIQGDALEELRKLPDKSVNMIMTSPPYWALRDYGMEEQLGLESTFDLYIKHLCNIFDEIKRVLRNDGTCWINMGDTYSATRWTGEGKGQSMNKFKDGYRDINPQRMTPFLDKTIIMIPFRFAIEMVNRGWILRNVIIWHKPQCMPSSVKDRFTVDFEYLFFFSKKQKYYFKTQYEPLKDSSKERLSQNLENQRGSYRGTDGLNNKRIVKAVASKISPYTTRPNSPHYRRDYSHDYQIYGKNKRTVWSINPQPFGKYVCNSCGYYGKVEWAKTKKGYFGGEDDEKRICPNCKKNIDVSHFAIYPEELCEIPIKAGCPKDGIVLDPFFGAGTTGLVALKQNKKIIGIELNKEYIKIAKERLKPFLEQTKL